MESECLVPAKSTRQLDPEHAAKSTCRHRVVEAYVWKRRAFGQRSLCQQLLGIRTGWIRAGLAIQATPADSIHLWSSLSLANTARLHPDSGTSEGTGSPGFCGCSMSRCGIGPGWWGADCPSEGWRLGQRTRSSSSSLLCTVCGVVNGTLRWSWSRVMSLLTCLCCLCCFCRIRTRAFLLLLQSVAPITLAGRLKGLGSADNSAFFHFISFNCWYSFRIICRCSTDSLNFQPSVSFH